MYSLHMFHTTARRGSAIRSFSLARRARPHLIARMFSLLLAPAVLAGLLLSSRPAVAQTNGVFSFTTGPTGANRGEMIWSASTLWLNYQVPGGIGATADFTTQNTGAENPLVVFFDQNATLGTLLFGSPSSGTNWTLSSNGSANTLLTMGVSSGLPSIQTGFFEGSTVSATILITTPLAGTQGVAINAPGKTVTWNSPIGLAVSGTGGFDSISGPITVNNGTLALSLANAVSGSKNLVNAGDTLVMGGGTMTFTGSAGTSSQTFNGTTIGAGASAVQSLNGSGFATLNLGAISRSAGGAVDFSSTSGTISTSSGNTNASILGGWADYLSSGDWAVVNSTGQIVTYTSNGGTYVNDTWAAGNNTTVTTGTSPVSGSTTNSIKFGTASTVTLTGTNVITSGGILATAAGNLGGGTGNITSGNGTDLIVSNNAAFTISASIVDNGATSIGLTKAGSGTLTLTNTGDSYSGKTVIGGGTLSIGSDTSGTLGSFTDLLGASPTVVINNGTLLASSSLTINSNRSVLIGPASGPGIGTISAASGTTLIYNGAISNNGANGIGNLLIGTGQTGIVQLGGTNTYSGSTTVNGGTLTVGATGVIPSNSPVLLASGTTLNLNGFNQTIGSLSGSGSIVTSSVAGNAVLTVDGSNSPLSFSGSIANNGSGTITLVKSGTGTFYKSTTSGTYGITTGPSCTINGGILAIGGTTDAALGTSGAFNSLVINGGMLYLAGTSNENFTTRGVALGNATRGSGGAVAVTSGLNPTGGTFADYDNSGTAGNRLTVGSTSFLPSFSSSGSVVQTLPVGTFAVGNASSTFSGGLTIASGILQITAGTLNNTLESTLGGGAPLGLVPSTPKVDDIVMNGGQIDGRSPGVNSPINGVVLNAPALNAINGTASGAVLSANRGFQIGPTSGFGTAQITTSGTNTNFTIPGVIADNGGKGTLLINTIGGSSAGTFTLGGVNTYSGGTLLFNTSGTTADTLSIAADSGLGAAPTSYSPYNLVLANSTQLQATGNVSTNNRGVAIGSITGGSVSISALNGQILNFGSTIDNNGGATTTLTLGIGTSNGTVVFGAKNRYGGSTGTSTLLQSVGSGTGVTLQTAVANAIPVSSAVTVSNGTTLDFNGKSQSIGSLAGSQSNMTALVTNTGIGAMTLTLGNDNTSPTFAGTITQPSGTISLTKVISGFNTSGTQTLTVASSSPTAYQYTGATTVDGGTLQVTLGTGATTNLINSNSQLVLGGGTLAVSAGGGSSSQTFNNTTLNVGRSVVSGNGNVPNPLNSLALGTITRNAGGTINFTQPATGSMTISNSLNSASILGGWATTNNGLDWADTLAGAVHTYAGYAAFATSGSAATTNYSLNAASTSLAGADSFNSVKMLTTAGTLDLSGNVITVSAAGAGAGGILDAGVAYTIQDSVGGGSLTAGSNELILNTTSTLSITASIAGSGGLTEGGTGTIQLRGLNTYSGTTVVSGGIVQVDTDDAIDSIGSLSTRLGNSVSVAINNGTLQFIGGFAGNGAQVNGAITLNSGRGVVLGPTTGFGGGTIDTQGFNVTVSGAVSDNSGVTLPSGNTGGIAGSGWLAKSGTGVLTLSGNNTFTGGIFLNAGTVAVSADIGLGAAPANFAQNYITMNGSSALELNGSFTLNANREIFAGGTAIVGVSGGNTVNYGGVIAGSSGFRKADSGTLVLNGVAPSTFNGGLAISGGKLTLDFANLATPTPTNLINQNNVLTLAGGELNIKDLSGSIPTQQTFVSTTIGSGASTVSMTVNGNTSPNTFLRLGLITRSVTSGGTVDFVIPSVGGILVTNASYNGIFGGGTGSLAFGLTTAGAFATANGGATWAVPTGNSGTNTGTVPNPLAGPVAAFTDYAVDNMTINSATASQANVDITQNDLALNGTTAITINTVRFSSANSQLVVGGATTFTLTNGGILVSPSANGTNPIFVEGNGNGSPTLATTGTGGGPDIIVHQYSTTAPLVLTPTVSPTNGGIVKTGPGSLVLTRSTTFTGGSFINQGTVALLNPGLGTSGTTIAGYSPGGPNAGGEVDIFGDLQPTISNSVNLSLSGFTIAGTGSAAAGGYGGYGGAVNSLMGNPSTSISVTNLQGTLIASATVNSVNPGSTLTLSGVSIGAAGTLTLGGAGNFFLAAASGRTLIDNATGTTYMNTSGTFNGGFTSAGGGTIVINGDTSLGDANNTMTFNSGGTLLAAFGNGTAVTIAATRTFALSGNTTLEVERSDTATAAAAVNYSNVISGTGNVTFFSNQPGATITLNGALANTYTGNTTISGVTLTLDYLTVPGSNNVAKINGGGTLTLGGTLNLLPNPGPGTTQTLAASITLMPNTASKILASSANGTFTLTTGANGITRNSGSTLDFNLLANYLVGTGVTNTNGIIGGWATVNGGNWAAVSGGSIVPYSGYTNDTWGSGLNTNVTVSGTDGSVLTTNSLRFNNGAPTTVTLSSSSPASPNRLTTGGILVENAAAVAAINGGFLSSASGELIVEQFNTFASFTISSGIVDTAAVGVTKSGAGTLILSGGASNTYTGPTVVTGGILQSGAANSIPTGGNVVLNDGGTLDLNLAANAQANQTLGTVTMSGASKLSMNGSSAANLTITTLNTGLFSQVDNGSSSNNVTLTIGNGTNTNSTISGIIANGAGTGIISSVTYNPGASGTVTLSPGFMGFASVYNSYGAAASGGGFTTIQSGTLILAPKFAPGQQSSANMSTLFGVVPSVATTDITINNGATLESDVTMQINTLQQIAIGPASGSGSATINVLTGNLLGIGTLVNNGTSISGLNKTGNGELMIVNPALYTGDTTVSGGTLLVGQTGGTMMLPATNLSVASSATFAMNNSTATTQYVRTLTGSGTIDALPADSGTNTSTQTLAIGLGLTGSDTFFGRIQNMVNNIAIAKIGTGDLTLTTIGSTSLAGYDFYSGGTTLFGGRLILDYTNTIGTTATNLLNGAGALTITGGTLTMNGSNVAASASSQQFATVTANGVGRIVVNNNSAGGTTTLNLLAITFIGALDFQPVNGSGTASITTPVPNNALSGILDAAATFNGGAGWAVNTGVGNVVGALSSYTSDSSKNFGWGNATNTTFVLPNIDVTRNESPSTYSVVDTLRFNQPTAQTVTLKGAVSTNIGIVNGSTAISGGILVTPSVGAHTSTISGGMLSAGRDPSAQTTTLYIQQFNTAAPLAISSSIVDMWTGMSGPPGPVKLVKAGGGELDLTGANGWTGGFVIGGGTVVVGAGDAPALPSGKTVTLNAGGTLDVNGNNVFIGLVSTGGVNTAGGILTNNGSGAATLTLALGNNNTFGGTIQDGSKSLALTLNALGNTTILQGTNTYTGATEIDSGALALDYSILNTQKISGTTLNMGGGTLSLLIINRNGTSQTLAQQLNVTFGSSIIMTAAGPTNTSSTFTLSTGANAIARTSGASINFVTNTNVTYAVGAGVTGQLVNGILGGWATVNGTDWATVSGGNIVALPAGSYTQAVNYSDLNSSAANFQDSSGLATPPTSPMSAYTLKVSNNGTIDLNGQTLTIGSASGPGGILWSVSTTIQNGTLAAGASNELILNTGSQSPTLDSSLTLSSSVTSLTVTGNGTLNFSATAASVTTLYVAGGTLAVGASTSLPSGMDVKIGAAGALNINGKTTIGSGTFSVNSLTGYGSVNGASSILKITGANATPYFGTPSPATLEIAGVSVLANSDFATATTVDPLGQLVLQNGALASATITVVGFGELDFQSGVNGQVAQGNNMITLNGTGNDGFGALKVLSGVNTIAATNGLFLNTDSTINVASGAVLMMNANGGGGALINTNGKNLTIIGGGLMSTSGQTGITGGGSLTYGGTGTLTLHSVAPGYSYGSLTISSTGTVSVNADNSLSGLVTFSGNGVLQFYSNLTVSHNIMINPGVTATLDTESFNVTYGGTISDPPGGVLDVVSSTDGTGVLFLTTTNTYSGGTVIGNATTLGGTLNINADANLGATTASPNITFANTGTLQFASAFTGPFSNSRNITVNSSATGTIDTNGNNISGANGAGGVLTLGPSATLIKTDSSVAAGTFEFDGTPSFGNNSSLQVNQCI